MQYEIDYKYQGKVYTLDVDESFVELPYAEQQARARSKVMAMLSRQKSDDAGRLTDELIEATVSPFRDTIELSGEAAQWGKDLMSQSVDNMKSGRAPLAPLDFLIGLSSWVVSPFTGFFQSFLGKPTETLTEAGLNKLAEITGKDSESVRAANKKFAQVAGQTAAIAPEILGPAGIARSAASILKAEQGSARALHGPLRVLAGEGKPPPAAQPLSSFQEWQQFRTVGGPDAGISPTSRLVKEGVEEIPVDLTTPGVVERMSLRTVGDITTDPGIISRVEELRNASPANRQRLFRDIGRELQESLLNGDVTPTGFMKILNDMGLDGKELFEVTVSESARTLNLLSQVARKMSNSSDMPLSLRQEMKVIADNLDKNRKVGGMEKFWQGWRNVENFARGTMVGQVATAMRNTWSQTGRLSLGILDDMIQGGLRGTTARESMKNIWDSVAADAKSLPGIRHILQRDQKLLNDILDGNPITKERLMNRSVHEVNAVNKLVTFVNGLNILQEKMFRRMAFQARLDKNLRSVGIDINDIDPTKIPAAVLEDAVEHALEISFASSGGRVARQIQEGFERIPFLYTINPYPRFAFGNALPFVFEHSPAGFAKAFSPRTIADLASGDSRRFTRAASRAMIGTMLMAKAWEIRNDPYMGGEKYSEVRAQGGVADVRPYSPLLAPYLFIAEAMKPGGGTLKPSDYAEMAIGLNRIKGTGLVMIDAIRGYDEKVSVDTITSFLGDWLGRFTVPLRTIKDVQQSIMGTEESLEPRSDIRGGNIIGPTASNLPFAERMLTERVSPLREGPMKSEPITILGLELPAGIARQTLGITIRKKNQIEAEVDRLGIKYGAWAFKSGLKEADRYLGRLIAPKLIRDTAAMMNSDVPVSSILPKAEFIGALQPNVAYKDLSDNGKRMALREMFGQQKKLANQQLKILEPELWKRMKLERIPSLTKEYVEEQRTGT